MTFEAKRKAGSLPRQAAAVSGWLALAATPTFALLGWMSAVGSPGMAMCSAASAFMPISDMALMYLLMSLFHLSPWLKLVSARSPHSNAPITRTEGD
ncbi:hypothetical protein VE25_16935 [Devosia geojensis]|uniref:Uncharacterized protein n=1 Tax=Devosia geojensis TaxID=443610 RepID=A0A0F5FR33_9HYPH|nr:hypothetical protein [Devosia geojensis]KKB10627.1 hypothetical protein VE25_16935 [Devosia geojensis]